MAITRRKLVDKAAGQSDERAAAGREAFRRPARRAKGKLDDRIKQVKDRTKATADGLRARRVGSRQETAI